MIINHNIAALNTYNKLNSASNAQAKSMEKLSSGLRINKAGDDAAGLAISEKMRGQIRGLDQASRNAQDGISLAQTAEGALNETHDILQRMRELAVQASNDTNTSTDRGEIQKEANQLTSEINRIGNTTEFNTQKLINGDKKVVTSTGTAHATAVAATLSGGLAAGTGTAAVNSADSAVVLATDFSSVAGASTMNINGTTVTLTNTKLLTGGGTQTLSDIKTALQADIDASGIGSGVVTVGDDGSGKLTLTSTATGTGASVDLTGTSVTGTDIANALGFTSADNNTGAAGASATAATGTVTIGAVTEGEKVTLGNKTVGFYDSNAGTYADANAAKAALGTDTVVDLYDTTNSSAKTATEVADSVRTAHAALSGQDVTLSGNTAAITVTATSTGIAGNSIATSGTGVTTQTGGVNLQIGANQSQSLTLDISDMRANALGITGTAGSAGFTGTNAVTDGTNNTATEASLDLSTASNASSAITKIQTAIDSVSAERSKLGAYQNRLDHTINNLGTSSENLTAAESRVRDVDMAKEMMNQTKNSILSQAAQAMLAQANQQPQGVLQLLR